jgi:hypothetical protein
MFIAYYLYSTLILAVTFGPALAPQTRLAVLFLVGLGVNGILTVTVIESWSLFS